MGIGQPGMEGKLGTLDAEAQSHQQRGYHQRQGVGPAGHQLQHRLLQAGEEELAGDAVEQGDSQQHQAGAQAAEDKVADGGHH